MSSTMLDVSCIDFEILDDDIEYEFQVAFGKYRWKVLKRYHDFVAVNKELLGMYGAQQIPYLTGEVAFWNKTSSTTAEKRQPKLEGYLSQLINGADDWSPPGFVVQVPSPNDDGARTSVNKFIFDFLQFTKYKPAVAANTVVLDKDTDSVGIENGTFTSAAAVAAPVVEPWTEEVEEEDLDDWVEVHSPTKKEPEAPSAPAVEQSLVSAANITSQVRVTIKNFTIHPKDRIDYNVHVALCGHSWQFPKRFTDFEVFHQELTAVYGAVVVPNLEGAKTQFWKKFDQTTGQMRQRFFEGFLREIIRDIDSWDPPLLVSLPLARKKADGNGTEKVTVFVSKLIFDFFNFQNQASQLSADMASEVVQQKRATLPSAIQQVIAKNKNAKMRQQIKSRLERRQKQRVAMSDAEVDDFCTFITSLDDDNDVLNVIRWLVANGWVNKDIAALERARQHQLDAEGQQRREEMVSKKIVGRKYNADGVTNTSMAFSETSFERSSHYGSARESYPQAANSSKSFVMESAAPSSSAKLGISSKQLVAISQAIFFDDTRRRAIQMLASILRDDEHIEEVLDTVVYEWDTLRDKVDHVMSGGRPEM